jgi:hypothetical protein
LKTSPQGVAVDVQGTEINDMDLVKGGAMMSGLKCVKCFLPPPSMEFLVGKVPRRGFSISGMLEILERFGKGLDVFCRWGGAGTAEKYILE